MAARALRARVGYQLDIQTRAPEGDASEHVALAIWKTLALQHWQCVQPNVLQFRPSAAEEHARMMRAIGEEHCLSPRGDRVSQARVIVLDIPLPVEVDMRPWRCDTCRLARRSGGDLSEGACRYNFPVTLAELQARYNGLLAVASLPEMHGRLTYATPAFLTYLLKSFYETLNIPETRRRLAEYYCTNALSFTAATLREGTAAQFLAASASQLRASSLQSIVLEGFRMFLHQRVALLRERQFVYNGQDIRRDGNYDLAIRVKHPSRKFSVLIAFCGTDGSLLEPPAVMETEAWLHIETLLDPLLHCL